MKSGRQDILQIYPLGCKLLLFGHTCAQISLVILEYLKKKLDKRRQRVTYIPF